MTKSKVDIYFADTPLAFEVGVGNVHLIQIAKTLLENYCIRIVYDDTSFTEFYNCQYKIYYTL